ncbi:MAG: TetR/AcrR family transcriptional regulator [Desulfobacteraceae bacterium]|nr:TetR/AcrR family transcriptional regulator [Desulfobacteraceae bacterium]MBC2751545.1 TetR/AcrR family transcriptional regulator [Desulfobacteraceae bacterium]
MGIAPQKNEHQIPTQVKNQDLVQRRRHQIVDAAVELFIQNGFHKTTTRQIAKAAGVSIGSLYEYVASKEDVLYLVCDAIHAEMQRGMAEAMQRVADQGNPLAEVVRAYLLVCDRMNDHILLIYQETQSLPHKWRRVVLENEVRITGLFTRALTALMADGKIPLLSEAAMDLVAHNIAVIGHMWTFRRWFLSRHYTIEDYIRHQTAFILNMCHTEEPVPDRRPGHGTP